MPPPPPAPSSPPPPPKKKEKKKKKKERKEKKRKEMADWTRIAWPPDSLIDHWAMGENTVKRFKNIIFKGYFCGTLPVTIV